MSRILSCVVHRLEWITRMECCVFLFREQAHSLQGALLIKSGKGILIKVTCFNVGLTGWGAHLGSKDRELEMKLIGRKLWGIRLVLEFLWTVGRKTSPVRHENEGTSFSEWKVKQKELAAAWTCQPERPWYLMHVTDPETTAHSPNNLPEGLARKPDATSGRISSVAGHLGSVLSI